MKTSITHGSLSGLAQTKVKLLSGRAVTNSIFGCDASEPEFERSCEGVVQRRTRNFPLVWAHSIHRAFRCNWQSLKGHGLFIALSMVWLCSLVGAAQADSLLAWSSGLLYVAYDTWLIIHIARQTRHIGKRHPMPTGCDPGVARMVPQPGKAPTPDSTPRLTMAVVVAARNEAEVIATTIRKLQAQTDVPEHIVIVNDGSTDHTAALLQAQFGLETAAQGLVHSTKYRGLSVLNKPHTGKADSLNRVCALLDTDLVVTVDADTWLEPTAAAAIRNAFMKEQALMAACGVLTPRCANTWAGRVFAWFQTYEYIRAFLSRAAWMQSNSLLLVSGAFAAYRRTMLQRIGGYDRNSLVEDYELIHRLHRYAGDHRLDWRVRVLPDATAQTDAPATLRTFLHQRRRWFAGFLKTQFQYRSMHGDARYGAVGEVMLPIKAADTLQPVFGITAFLLMIAFLVNGSSFGTLIFWVIGGKLLIDFSYHIWAIRLYHRWLDKPVSPRTWLMATLSTLAEPFSFQILRHAGAVWGWVTLITGQRDWITQRTIGETQ